MITILCLPVQFLDWQRTVLRFAKTCEHARTVFTTQLLGQDPQISALETIGERVEFETAILKVEAESQSMPERHPETFADNDIPDFASLLREPTLPVPDANNSLGVSPPPSHLIPKKITK
jgi:hypothetical protein